VRVTVTDKGPGIPEEFRGRLFQKFSQADSSDTRQKGGTGLGLAICKEIIERMGGSVGVDSIPGKGASFYFDLPCEDAVPSPLPSHQQSVNYRES
jgi:signal transduction histidine kinase